MPVSINTIQDYVNMIHSQIVPPDVSWNTVITEVETLLRQHHLQQQRELVAQSLQQTQHPHQLNGRLPTRRPGVTSDAVLPECTTPPPYVSSTSAAIISLLNSLQHAELTAGTETEMLLSSTASLPAADNGGELYKTELCRAYEERGQCRYGDKCQFAHGINDLRTIDRHPKYKTELCRTYHSTGFCPYGARCHFVHNEPPRIASATKPESVNTGSRNEAVTEQLRVSQIAAAVFSTAPPTPTSGLLQVTQLADHSSSDVVSYQLPVRNNNVPSPPPQSTHGKTASNTVPILLQHRRRQNVMTLTLNPTVSGTCPSLWMSPTSTTDSGFLGSSIDSPGAVSDVFSPGSPISPVSLTGGVSQSPYSRAAVRYSFPPPPLTCSSAYTKPNIGSSGTGFSGLTVSPSDWRCVTNILSTPRRPLSCVSFSATNLPCFFFDMAQYSP